MRCTFAPRDVVLVPLGLVMGSELSPAHSKAPCLPPQVASRGTREGRGGGGAGCVQDAPPQTPRP